MSLYAITLQALAPLFLLIVLGYGLKRVRLLHIAHVPIFNGLVVNVTLPALIVKGLATAPHLAPATFRLPLALFAAQAAVMGLAWLIGKALKWPAPLRGALMMVGTFGNTGFVGYPVTLALLPHQFPASILIDQFGMTIPMYLTAPLLGASFGTAGGAKTGRRAALLRIARSPMLLSLGIGIVIRLIPWPAGWADAPPVRALSQCLTYLGQGTTPLVLLALGVALRPGAARAYKLPLFASCVLKLAVCPLLMAGLCHAFGLRGELLRVGVLQSAMPTAVMASVLSGEHDLAGDYAVGAVFASTLLAALTVPFLVSVLG